MSDEFPSGVTSRDSSTMPFFDMPLHELREYRPKVSIQDDFDVFWGETLHRARSFDRPARVTRVDVGLLLVDTFDVSFAGYDGQSVLGWLTVPKGVAPTGVIIEYNGYGGGRGLPHERLKWPTAGYAHFLMDTRGQGSSWGSGGDTPDEHSSSASVPGFMTRGILDPDRYYYRRVFTDAVRAVDAIRSLDIADRTRFAVSGGSQGGGISIAVAGLVDGLSATLPDVPFLSHFERAIGLTASDPYGEIVRYLSVHRTQQDAVMRTLSYFDAVNFAARASSPALFSTALMDPVCPPSTVFAAVNAWKGPVDVRIYPYNEHEGGGEHHWADQLAWLGETVSGFHDESLHA